MYKVRIQKSDVRKSKLEIRIQRSENRRRKREWGVLIKFWKEKKKLNKRKTIADVMSDHSRGLF